MLGLVLVLLVSLLCGSAYADCEPVEEGNTTTVTCKANVHRCPHLTNNTFTWFSDLTPIASCIDGNCSDYFSTGYSVVNQGSVSTLTIRDVSRKASFNTESPFICVGPCFDNSVACKRLQIYAKPEDPVCSTNQIRQYGGTLTFIVTCSTSKVYPQAQCKFEWLRSDGIRQPMNGSVNYRHSTTRDSPVYYRSQCTVSVSVQELGEGTHSFFGYIYPGVDDGEHLAEPIDVVTVNITEATRSNDKLFWIFDQTTIIVVGVAVFIVVVLLIAIVALVRRNRHLKETKSQDWKMAIKRYSEPRVNSGGIRITHEDFGGNSDRPESCEIDGSPTPTANKNWKLVSKAPRPSLPSLSTTATTGPPKAHRPSLPSLNPPQPGVSTTLAPKNALLSASTPPRPYSGYVLPSSIMVEMGALDTSDVEGSSYNGEHSNRAFDYEDAPVLGCYENYSRNKPRGVEIASTSKTVLGARKNKARPMPHTRGASRVPPVPPDTP